MTDLKHDTLLSSPLPFLTQETSLLPNGAEIWEAYEQAKIHAYLPNGRKHSRTTPYFDPKYNQIVVKVHPGHYTIIQNQAGLLSTILGSCISVCLHDPINNIGGMNHFMAPASESGLWCGKRAFARYGNYAMSHLIKALLQAGANYQNLIVKIFGATHSLMETTNVALENEMFIRAYFDRHDLRVSVIDLGGNQARSILFNTQTGQVWRRLISVKTPFSHMI